jgi:hypothetical protein
VQVVHDPAVALRRDALQAMGGETRLFATGKLLLRMLALLVIELVGGFERSACNQAGDKARLVGGEGSKHGDPRIKGDKEVLVDLGWFRFDLVDHLHDVVVRLGHDTNLLDALNGMSRSPLVQTRADCGPAFCVCTRGAWAGL